MKEGESSNVSDTRELIAGEPAEEPRPSGAGSRLDPSHALLLASAAFLALAAFVFGSLLFPEQAAPDATQSEQFFFEINEAAGAPVLILAIWLFYRRSNQLDVLRGPGDLGKATGLFVASSLLFAWGHFTVAPDLQLASLVGLLFATLLAWGGREAVRAFWIPVAFLIFALPISPILVSSVIWPLQLVTAQISGVILNLIGFDNFVVGDQILRPENTFVVIESCSGLRSVVTLTMLTVLLIDLFERRGRHALLLVLLAPAIALSTNCMRVVTLVLNPHSDVASIHSLQGIVMLLVGLFGIYFVDLLLERALGSDTGAENERLYGDAQPHVDLDAPRIFALALPTLAVLIVIASGLLLRPWNPRTAVPRTVDALVVEALGDLSSKQEQPDYKFRGGIHFRGFSRRVVSVDRKPVQLLVGLANPTNRKLTVFSRRLDRPGSGFEAAGESRVALTQGAPVARRVVLQRGSARLLSYSWYEPEPSLPVEFVRHALALDRSPFARSGSTVAVRLSTRLWPRETDAEAEARLVQVYDRIKPTVETLRAVGADPP